MAMPPTIATIEKEMDLVSPYTDVPAFVDPVWTFSYWNGNDVIRIGANYIGYGDPYVDSKSDRSKFQYAGVCLRITHD
jgi:hypothetical protein